MSPSRVTFPPHLLSGALITICFPTSFQPGSLSMAGELSVIYVEGSLGRVYGEYIPHICSSLKVSLSLGVPWGSLPIFLKI